MAIELSILEIKATNTMAKDPKELRKECPKANREMVLDAETGIAKVKATGLVPIFFLQSIPERGWFAGEVTGVLPINAKQIIAKEIGMELVGAAEQVGKKDPPPAKKEGKPAPAAAA